MRCYTNGHEAYWGIELPARTLSVCLVTRDGEILLPRPMPTPPAILLKALAPSRQERVGAVACLVTWDWLADLGVHDGLPCGRGHAPSLQASHGGPAPHDRLDAQHMAGLRRGGMWPPA
jgi:hypothetical protein